MLRVLIKDCVKEKHTIGKMNVAMMVRWSKSTRKAWPVLHATCLVFPFGAGQPNGGVQCGGGRSGVCDLGQSEPTDHRGKHPLPSEISIHQLKR